jgi:hypothetical protein
MPAVAVLAMLGNGMGGAGRSLTHAYLTTCPVPAAPS